MRPPTGLSARLCLEVARKIDGVSYAACQALVFGHIDSQLLQSATDKKRDFDRIGLKPDYSQMSGRFGGRYDGCGSTSSVLHSSEIGQKWEYDQIAKSGRSSVYRPHSLGD